MRIARWRALVLSAPALLFAASACLSTGVCRGCQDIVTTVPFQAGETYTYQLLQDDKPKGDFELDAVADGSGRLVLKQLSNDGQGNSDNSQVTVDAATLKPISGQREVTDSSQRTLLETSYDAIDKSKCGSGIVVNVKQSVFKPPADATPSSVRSNPRCAPEFGYDNDTSLFIWRTIKLEKGYTVTYRTVLTNRQTDQIVTLTVKDQTQVTTPAGTFDAWYVEITADESTQQAWVATTPDRRILRYQNANLTFLLAK